MLLWIHGLKYVPSRRATNAEETRDIKKRISTEAQPNIVAKEWQSALLSHTMTARRSKMPVKESGGRDNESVAKVTDGQREMDVCSRQTVQGSKGSRTEGGSD